jgi:glutamate-1-semialdehyde aminotransferase
MRFGLKKGIKISNKLYKKAKKFIASGTNTFSRAPGVFPDGGAPKILEKQKGCHVWDVDGNKFIDMVMGCGPVTLGHCDKRIDKAIKSQLKKGILFSMINTLEVELAEQIVKTIPSAEMVKFSKNASDVCAASIKLARYITGKKIIFCYGYNGFQDWYIGSTDKNAGIPDEIKKLTIPFDYGNIDALEKMFKKYKNQVAAVIMEPVIGQRPKCGYKDKRNPRSSLKACINCPQTNALKRIKLLAKKNKALFILDECISGFRFNIGGAQNYFGVSADLSIFGKGVTNGMPLGILTGKKKYMKHFDKVFLSSTYAPEALTLAAAIENLKILKKDNVIKSLWEKGEYIEKNFTNIITKYSISQYVSLAGYPVRLMINTHDVNGKQDRFLSTLYQQEMFKNGILCFAGVLMLSQSLKLSDLNILINAFDKTCFKIKSAIDSNRPFKKLLTCKPMSPVFKGLRERNAVSN